MFLEKYKNYIQYGVIVILGIFLLLSVRQCSENKAWKNEYKENYQQTKDSFKSVINDKNQQIAIQEEKVIKRGEKAEQLADSISQLKQVNRQIKIKTKGKIKNDTVKIDSPVYISNCDSTNVDTNKYLKVPVTFGIKEKWYSVEGTIGDTGLISLDQLTWLSKPTITIGTENKTFFKDMFTNNDIKITYKNDNPYTRVETMDNIKIKDKLKKDKRFGVGPIVGYGFVGSETGWVVGFAASYHLIKF